MQKIWNLAPIASNRERALIHDHHLIAQLLFNRGIRTREEADGFLFPDYVSQTHDPFLMDDMPRAIERIVRALIDNEKIIIYGDYDVDGVCASTILFEFFTSVGANVDVYMNHRERDGYGMQMAAVDALADEETKLIITNDSGISNKQEVAHANIRGVDVIITDHHHVPEDPADIPAAYAIIHPRVRADRYPFKDLAGGGTAFKLVQALIRSSDDPEFVARKQNAKNPDGSVVNWEAFEKWLLDIVAISTIGDCMPLLGENRMFVRYGMLVLQKTRRLGLQYLIKSFSDRIKSITPQTVGYYIGPRINAASRMDHGKTAFSLMTARDEDTAHRLSLFLEEKNTERQRVTERMMKEACELVEPMIERDHKMLVAYKEDWPLGVLGLVAGKLTTLYNRPALLVTNAHGTRAGTGRSIPGLDLTKLFKKLEMHFERFGGHAAAGGFSLKTDTAFTDFSYACEEAAAALMNSHDLVPTLSLDVAVRLSDITKELLELLCHLEPHGQKNQKPLFLLEKVTISDIKQMGKNNAHLRLTVAQDGVRRKIVGFSFGSWIDQIRVGDSINCVCEIEENEWNGVKEIQLSLKDIRQSI